MIDADLVFQRYDSDREDELRKLPVCDECRSHIQDEYYYEINGLWLCEECIEAHKVWIER